MTRTTPPAAAARKPPSRPATPARLAPARRPNWFWRHRRLQVANPNDGSAYFVQYVRDLLYAQYGKPLVLSGGLRITTTLDSAMQQRAYDAIYGPGAGGLTRAGRPRRGAGRG